MQSNAQVAHELEITKQEIDDEAGVDLGQHGVLVVADEGLDPQVLLDDAEEDLDLPAFFVDIGDGLGRQLEMVGEKDVAPAGGAVPVGDTAQGHGAFLACESDDLVGEQARLFLDLPMFQHCIVGVALLSGDEKDFLDGELGVPGIVGVAQVCHDNRAFG